jgi:hypothetical protein
MITAPKKIWAMRFGRIVTIVSLGRSAITTSSSNELAYRQRAGDSKEHMHALYRT